MIAIDGKTVDQAFVEAATLWPDAPFVIAPETDAAPIRVLTYGDMAQAVEATARAAAQGQAGASPNSPVLTGPHSSAGAAVPWSVPESLSSGRRPNSLVVSVSVLSASPRAARSS